MKARILHRSPSHICRVLKGERKPSAASSAAAESI